MWVDYVASEDTRVHTRIGWEGGFPQWLLQLTLKDISGFMYENV